jgi:hypothetical protein
VGSVGGVGGGAHGQKQPTTTIRILSFRGFDGCTQGGADAAKWLKSN